MTLETERKYYQERKAELLKYYEGQVALIKGEKLIGTYTTPEEAFSAGIEQLGNVSFLIKGIREQAEVIQHPALAVGIISVNP